MKLRGKKIAITGAFGSLGAAAVVASVQEGAKVIAIDRLDADLAPDYGADVTILGCCDLTDAESTANTMAKASEAYGGLDGLLNIAGGFRWETVGDGTVDTWEAMFKINVRTAMLASQAALSHFSPESGAAIVNISAMAANKSEAGLGAYSASKAGVARLTEAMAAELKDRGIRVNAVLPSIIDTAPNRADMPDADYSKWVQPQDLAKVLVFLLSNDSTAVTGALLPVAGRV